MRDYLTTVCYLGYFEEVEGRVVAVFFVIKDSKQDTCVDATPY